MFPNSIWDGTSNERHLQDYKPCGPEDFIKMRAELIATQQYLIQNTWTALKPSFIEGVGLASRVRTHALIKNPVTVYGEINVTLEIVPSGVPADDIFMLLMLEDGMALTNSLTFPTVTRKGVSILLTVDTYISVTPLGTLTAGDSIILNFNYQVDTPCIPLL